MNYFTDMNSPSVTSERVIYTASDFARSSLLSLQETGTLSALKPHTSSRSNLDSYLYFTVLSGSGRLTYGGETYELRAGDSVFLRSEEQRLNSSHRSQSRMPSSA